MQLEWSSIRGIRWLVFAEFGLKRLFERIREADAENVGFMLEFLDEVNDAFLLERPRWV
jgi:hypothetical protein